MSPPSSGAVPAAPDLILPWIESARAGSREALGRLLQACRPYLLQVAGRHLGPALRAKLGKADLVQDAFCRAHRKFPGFRGQTCQELRAWLRRILLNRLANLRRAILDTGKRQARREVALEALPDGRAGNCLDPALSPCDQAIQQEQAQALRHALDRLPWEHCRLIDWRNYDLLPFEEIGRRVGCSADAARKRWRHALHLLGQLLRAPP
jgi:RNA polymerase sigma-70 factor (ECF subfamily)